MSQSFRGYAYDIFIQNFTHLYIVEADNLIGASEKWLKYLSLVPVIL